LSPVAHLAEDLIEVEDVVEGDPKSPADLCVIVFQAEAHLEDLLGGDDLGGGFLTFTPMKLKDEGFVGEGELYDVGAVTFLSLSESWFGFSVKSGNPSGKNFIDCILAFGSAPRYVNLFGGKSREGG